MDIQTGPTQKAPRIIVYGEAGVGKTYFGNSAKNPIFIQTEEGANVLGPDRFPLAESFEDLMGAVKQLSEEDHKYKTVVVDSLDWAEHLIHKEVCRAENVPNIEKIPYAKGMVFALEFWRQFLDGLNSLRDQKKMCVLMLAHSQVKNFADPENIPYDRYEIKLNKHASSLVRENADIIGFAHFRMNVQEIDSGFGKKVNRAVGAGERELCLSPRPAWLAKSRYPVPDTIDLSWSELMSCINKGLKELEKKND